MALVRNQYSDLIPEYWYHEYKQTDTTEERKEEIQEEFFKILRGVNTFPRVEDNLENEIQSLRALINTDVYKVYDEDKKEIKANNNGLDFLYKFYPNIWEVTKKDFPISCYDGFYIDKKLKRCIKKVLTYSNSTLDIVKWLRMAGCGYCTNFRPTASRVIYEFNAPKQGAKIIDSSNGYGGRLLGAWSAENVVEYVSTDPNTKTYENTLKLIKYLNKYYDTGTRMETHCLGSEDFTVERFPHYKNYFDLYFTSPPYFDCEKYSGEDTQSYVKFNNYAGWVKGFYRPTIHNMINMLREDGVGAINIFEKVTNIKEITKAIFAERGFYLYKTDSFIMRGMPGAIGKDENGNYIKRDTTIGNNTEPIWYFMHYEALYKKGFITEQQYNKFKERD